MLAVLRQRVVLAVVLEIDRELIDAEVGERVQPLELRLDFADGTSARETLWLEDERSEVSIELARAPLRVTPDPDTWLLATVELEAR